MQRTSLQRRLSVGIIIALSVITLFFVMTTALFRDIERFIDLILTPDIRIARLYERCGDFWNQIDDQLTTNLADLSRQERLVSEELIAKFEGTIAELDGLVTIPERRAAFIEIARLAGSYTMQLSELDRHSRRRGEINKRDGRRRMTAAQAISARTTELTKRFKRMLEDFTRTLNSQEFKQSLSNTSSMIATISRIEKDLQVVEAEIGLYVARKTEFEKQPGTGASRLSLPDRIQKRLQAVLGLLMKSIDETHSPIQIRVLGNIRTSINDFKTSFLDLRDMLERPDSEKIEIDDLLTISLERIETVFDAGQHLIVREADAFWTRIHSTSGSLVVETKRDFYISLFFLLIAAGSGAYAVIFFPRRIAGPLQILKKQMKTYRLGDSPDNQPIQSDTEEIYSLTESFRNLALGLHEQAGINKTYLKTIQEMTDIYRDLEGDKVGGVGTDTKARLEKAIGRVLRLLVETLPEIGLVKVMIKVSGPDGRPTGFVRLGDPEFTEEFRRSAEFLPYAASTGWPVDQKMGPGDETLPWPEGLTCWYYENMLGRQSSGDDSSFFRRTYEIPSIQDNPILRERTHEQGLEGNLLLEPLKAPLLAIEANPLMGPDHIGVLFVYFPEPDTKLSLQDISFIKIIADQLSSLIETDKLLIETENKRKLEYQLSMASEIQENLLPQRTPAVPGLKISRVSKSAAEVGGDYYDFFDLGGNRLGLVIADASGKNVPAAIIMTVFKTTLSTMDLADLPAAEVLTKANEIIQRNITNDRFITAMYAIIDAGTGAVELACAGHNPAIVASRRNGVPALEERSASGLPLGIVSMKYQSTRFSMQSGDLLVMYTDGVTEARNLDGAEYGIGALRRFLTRPRSSNPAVDLLEDVKAFTGDAPQYDDITAVTVEFHGSGK